MKSPRPRGVPLELPIGAALLGGLLRHPEHVADLAPRGTFRAGSLHVVVDELVAEIDEGPAAQPGLADLDDRVRIGQVGVDLLDQFLELDVEWSHASSVG